MSVMSQKTGPLRDSHGTAKYRHEIIACVLRADPDDGLSVLVTRRVREPFQGRWGLPSGALETGESLDDSLRRHLADRTGLTRLNHLEQLETRGAPDRDPADRTIATAYLGLVASPAGLSPDAVWLPVPEAVAEAMAFDHAELVAVAVDRLRAKLSYTNIGFALVDEEFTVSQLRDTYATVLGYQVNATNLRRILERRRQLEPTGTTAPSGTGGGRPAALFRFSTRTLQVTDPSEVLRP